MATIVRYVNTAGTVGSQDGTTNTPGSSGTAAYATLAQAEAALRQTLTGVTCDVADVDGNAQIALDIRCTGTSTDTTVVTFTNASWVTDATHRIQVRLNPNDTAAGPKWDTSIYRLVVSAAYGTGSLSVGKALDIDFVNLQVENTNTITNSPQALVLGNFVWNVRIVGGFYRCTSTTGTWDEGCTIRTDATGALSLRMRNVTAVNAEGTAFNGEGYTTTVANALLYNCTLVNRSVTSRTKGVARLDSYDSGGSNRRFKNLLIQGPGTTSYQASSPTETATILTQDASSPTVGLRSLTTTFVDAANWDYHLAAADATAKDVGTSLAADATWPFSTDGDGVARAGTWDVGADEYAAAGGGGQAVRSATLMLQQQNN